MVLTRKVRVAKVVIYNKTTKEIENIEVEILTKKVRDVGKYVESVLEYPVTILDVEEVFEINETYDVPTDLVSDYKLVESED